MFFLGYRNPGTMDQAARIYSQCCWWLHWFRKRVAISVPLLQKWRWRISDSVPHFLDLRRDSDFPAGDWHGTVHGSWWYWSVGPCSLLQRHWMGFIGDCLLAQCLLYRHIGLEHILSFPIIQVNLTLIRISKERIDFNYFLEFSAVLPWSTCGNEWNTDCCSTNRTHGGLVRPENCTETKADYPEQEYWK